MTQPGSTIPPTPGWWPRTNRVGVADISYGWSVDLTGQWSGKASYRWRITAAGQKPGVKLDAVGAGATTNLSALSWEHDAAAHACVIVEVAVHGSALPTSVTYGGTEITYVGRVFRNNSSLQGSLSYYKVSNVAAGTRTVAVTLNGGAYATGQSFSYSGVDHVELFRTNFGSGAYLTMDGLNVPNGVALTTFSAQTAVTAMNGTSRYAGGGFAYMAVVESNQTMDFVANMSSNFWCAATLILSPYRKPLYIKGITKAPATNVLLPGHDVGDLLVVGAYAGNSTTITKPGAAGTVPAWVDIDANTGASSNAMRTAQFVATATNHTTGNWVSASDIFAVVLTGQGGIGGHDEGGSTSADGAAAPPIIMDSTDGTSVLLHFFGRRNSDATAWDAPPSGYTRIAKLFGGVGACVLTKDTTTADGSITIGTDGSTVTGYRGATVEITT